MGALQPQVVHFTIVLAIIGVAFRLVSLLGKPAFASPAATTLLLLAALSSVVSVRSGTAVHGPVERAPGARPAVMEHEEWGERTLATLLIVGAIELLGLALRKFSKVHYVHGLAAAFCVYEAGKHGGELVYAYAGRKPRRSPARVSIRSAMLPTRSAGFPDRVPVTSPSRARLPRRPSWKTPVHHARIAIPSWRNCACTRLVNSCTTRYWLRKSFATSHTVNFTNELPNVWYRTIG